MKLFLKDTEKSSMTQGKKTPNSGILSYKEQNKRTVMSRPTKRYCAFPWSRDRRCNHKTGITPVCFWGSQEKVLQLKMALKTWSWLQVIAQYMTNCKRLWRPPRVLKEKNIKAFPRFIPHHEQKQSRVRRSYNLLVQQKKDVPLLELPGINLPWMVWLK